MYNTLQAINGDDFTSNMIVINLVQYNSIWPLNMQMAQYIERDLNPQKGSNGITLFKDYAFFCPKSLFEIFFSDLLLDMLIFAPIYHMLFVNNCWINVKF